MNLRSRVCYLLSLLGIHSPDCEYCNADKTRGGEMRARLDELDRRTRSVLLKNGNRGEVVKVPGSVLPKV